MIFSVFLVSLIPVVFHRKLPVLKRVTKKSWRLLLGVGFVFVPANIAGWLFGRNVQTQVAASYNLNLMDFKKYRENKDLTEVNHTLKFSEY